MLLHSVCLAARAVEDKELPCRTKDVLLFYVCIFLKCHCTSEFGSVFSCYSDNFRGGSSTISVHYLMLLGLYICYLLLSAVGRSVRLIMGEKKSCSDLNGVIWLSQPGYLENWHLKPALSKQKSKCFRCWKTVNGDES